jgi:acyl carrier protein
MTVAAEIAGRAEALAAALAQATGVDVRELPEHLDTPLRSLSIDSLLFVAFLTTIEEEHGFTWDEDTPPEALATITAMASFTLGSSA